MRILSLWQPWASLLVGGAKRIETRSWSTGYRGPIAIHASKHWTGEERMTALEEPFRSALVEIGFTSTGQLPLGAILGVVTLTDCLEMIWAGVATPSPAAAGQLQGHGSIALSDSRVESDRAFGNYQPGRFAWMTGPERLVLPEPIPYRGTQGLRDLDPAVAARLA